MNETLVDAKFIMFRATPGEYAEIRERSGKVGLSMGNFLRVSLGYPPHGHGGWRGREASITALEQSRKRGRPPKAAPKPAPKPASKPAKKGGAVLVKKQAEPKKADKKPVKGGGKKGK